MWKKFTAIFTTLLVLLAMPASVFAGDMYRFYNPNSGEHFYTASYNEGSTLSRAGWKYEGIGWVAPDNSSTPVYRLYNPNNGDHHYTTNAGEQRALVRIGWRDEGIGWYSDDQKTVPMYRSFNPNARTGAHNFTTSEGEYQMLANIGWKPEGVAWYASAAGRDGQEISFPQPARPAAPAAVTPSNGGGAQATPSQTTPVAGTVYWTPSGKKYHKRNCPTLKRSRTILSGSVADAGGRTACNVCF